MKLIGVNSAKKNKVDGIVLSIMLVMLLTILLLIATIYSFILIDSQVYIVWFGILMLCALTVAGLLLAISGITVLLLWYNKDIPKPLEFFTEVFMPKIYPVIEGMGKALGYDKKNIRRAYTAINNKVVYSKEYGLKGQDILVLTPHCIQQSQCTHKLTVNINNCTCCGRCSVSELIDLSKKYNIMFRLVSGGTVARRIIQDTNPKAIIAIACERDLISGLMDTKKIPVIAVINIRPEGPCINTLVNIKEVEKAIIHFIGE